MQNKYQINIVRVIPKEEIEKQMKERDYDSRRHNFTEGFPMAVQENVLCVELTQDQFDAIKKAVLEKF